YQGTVLLVSHDREVLNNVVTQTLAFEGNGHWGEYVGGYDEWLAQRPEPAPPAATPRGTDAGKKESAAPKPEPVRKKPVRPGRLASWEQKELDEMPDKIAAIEARQAELAGELADGSLYRDAPQRVEDINQQLEKLEEELAGLFERWETLENKQTG